MVNMIENDDFDYDFDSDAARERRERSDRSSRKMGELLLRGYRMLAEECNQCGCILMQFQNNPSICVNCEENTQQNQANNQRLEPQNIQMAANNTFQLETVKKDPTEKIGELLLKGYTMLNDTCDKCNTILMRDRQGKKTCVCCDDENSKTQLVSNTSNSKLIFESRIDDIKQEKKDTILQPHHYLKHHQTDVEMTILDKIELANRRLKVETDVEKITELCNMIKSAAEALNALKICFKHE